MEQDAPTHWYMRLEPQGFSIFPLEERDAKYDRNFHYIGQMTKQYAYQKSNKIWPAIARKPTLRELKELERTVAGTE